MKRKKLFIIGAILLVLIITGILIAMALRGHLGAPEQKPANEDLAQKALTDFLQSLHAGRYQMAADLYSGSYEVLEGYNPDIAPTERATLLERACTINGFQCLQPQEIMLDETTSEGEYIFSVSFQNENGELLVIGPCCGADETDSPPVSEFSFTVTMNEQGQYQVANLPPYIP